MKNLAPIILFTYNRKDHLKRTIESLQKNQLAKESEIFIFSDGPKSEEDKQEVSRVREYIKTITEFKKVEIRQSEKNQGLANSIIAGVTEVVNRYGKVIVMEDDLLSSPHFLKFMNEALNIYENEERVASIHGYLYPIKSENLPETFFIQHTSSWGWATWKRAWDLFEPDGYKLMKDLRSKNLTRIFNINNSYNFIGMLQRQIDGITNSWAIRWNASSLVNDKLNLYPKRSLIQNIGQDGSGEHKGNSNKHDVFLSATPISLQKIGLVTNKEALKELRNFYISLRPTFQEKIIRRIRNTLLKTKNFIHNCAWETGSLYGELLGIKTIKPNPKLPNYYLFLNRFNQQSTIIDVGCGFDADMSMYMINELGISAIGIDPTLKHKEGLDNLVVKTGGKFSYKPWAISSMDGQITFNESLKSVSGSILDNHINIRNNQGIKKYSVESVSLGNLPRKLDLEKIDFIKLDLEGAEYDLIANLTKDELDKYDQIFIEFHHHAFPNFKPQDTLNMVKKIKSFGFKAFTLDNHDFLFYR